MINIDINIQIKNKIAIVSEDAVIVCGNSGYIINFDFDEEWSEAEEKTARFVFGNNYYIDVNFTGNVCEAPIITDAREVSIGVYAGELTTTTPARINCKKSIVCDSVSGTKTNPVIVTKGDDGKSAYEIAVEHGFEGTEEEWVASLNSGGGTSDHSKLTNRDLKNQHPISAITDLQKELDNRRKTDELIHSNFIIYEKTDPELDMDDRMSVQIAIDLIFSVMKEMVLDIPEKTSQLENDSGFVNAEYVTNAINGTLVEPLEIELEAGGTLTFEFDDADNTFVKMYADTSAGINVGDTIVDIEFMYKGNYLSIKDMYTVDGTPYFYNMGKTFEGDSGIFVGSIGFSSGFNDVIQAFYDYEEMEIKIKYYSAE